jgi:hypothetical protein
MIFMAQEEGGWWKSRRPLGRLASRKYGLPNGFDIAELTIFLPAVQVIEGFASAICLA